RYILLVAVSVCRHDPDILTASSQRVIDDTPVRRPSQPMLAIVLPQCDGTLRMSQITGRSDPNSRGYIPLNGHCRLTIGSEAYAEVIHRRVVGNAPSFTRRVGDVR